MLLKKLKNKIIKKTNNNNNNKIYSKYVSSYAIKGKFITVMRGSKIDSKSSIGSYTYIGINSFITKTVIGNYVSIANNVSIGIGEHKLDKISTSSFFYDNAYEVLTEKDCIIGNDVWIGVDSIIRRGVCIGNGAVIGANSFVNSDVPDFAVVAGSPAKIIKFRFTKEQREQITKSKWWEYDLETAKQIIAKLEKNILNNNKTKKYD